MPFLSTVEPCGEGSRGAIGGRAGWITRAMTMKEMKAGDATSRGRFRTSVDAEDTAVNSEPWREVAPMLEDVE